MMMLRSRPLSLIGVSLVLVPLVLVPSGRPLAQEASGAQKQSMPVFGAETVVVALPVFVTDKGGQSVPGLTSSDFVVEDGGRPAELVAFEAVDAGSAPVEASTAGPTSVEAAARRQFLLLFDLGFSTPAGINRSRTAALDFLGKGLGPRDLASVAILGPAAPACS
jgi:hypothetical protein